jgi:hypothetical protein
MEIQRMDWFALAINLLVGIFAAAFGVISTLFLANYQTSVYGTCHHMAILFLKIQETFLFE